MPSFSNGSCRCMFYTVCAPKPKGSMQKCRIGLRIRVHGAGFRKGFQSILKAQWPNGFPISLP